MRTASRESNGGGGRIATAVILGVGAVGVAALMGNLALQRRRTGRAPDDAPDWTTRALDAKGRAVSGRSVTINRPRAELYAFWRDFQNLPRFMENIESVDADANGITRWTIAAPGGGNVGLETEITEERENEVIAWRSTPNSDVETEGRVTFADAPGDRGTRVFAVISYKPPFGELGRRVAKVFQHEPEIQARRELKRFKMLMETGEIATAKHCSHDSEKD